nr:parp-type zinc finger-containing protein c2a9.07c [Quercus suber]
MLTLFSSYSGSSTCDCDELLEAIDESCFRSISKVAIAKISYLLSTLCKTLLACKPGPPGSDTAAHINSTIWSLIRHPPSKHAIRPQRQICIMPAYRIEIASTGRAGCNATHCKKNNVKIPKGEIRQGVWVDYEDRGSYKWRHWGCITPEVLHNWHETSEGQTDLIDGFDELPEAAQVKLQRALEQGHVDDEDWNGQEADADDDPKATPVKKSAGKKRKATKAELDEEDEVPKKAGAGGKGKKVKAAANDDDDDGEVEVAPKRSKAKNSKVQADEEEDSGPKKAPAAKKSRSKKAAPVEQAAEDDADEAPEPAPKPAATKRGKKKSINNDAEDAVKAAPAAKTKPQKRKTKATKGAATEE